MSYHSNKERTRVLVQNCHYNYPLESFINKCQNILINSLNDGILNVVNNVS